MAISNYFVLFYFLESTKFLKSIDVFLSVKNITYFGKAIEEVVQEVGEGNVVHMVTNNPESYIAAGKLFKFRKFDGEISINCLNIS